MQEKPQFFKRKASIVKVHMLLLAHMDRLDIPPLLHKDLEFVLKKSTIFLEEMIKIANIPRFSPYGWLTPTIGAIEMLQCLTQAVSIGSRKTFSHGKARTVLPPAEFKFAFETDPEASTLGNTLPETRQSGINAEPWYLGRMKQ